MRFYVNGLVGMVTSAATVLALSMQSVEAHIRLWTGILGLGVTATTFVVGLYRALDYLRQRRELHPRRKLHQRNMNPPCGTTSTKKAER